MPSLSALAVPARRERPVGAAAAWPATARVAAALVACAAAAAAGALALHHPLAPAWIAVVALAAAGLVAWRPVLGFLLVPALLPAIGLAPWSGWLTFEELDILVLAVAAGSWLRLALGASAPGAARGQAALGALASFALLLFAISVAVSTARGFGAMGEAAFGWFQGLREPMNAVRLGKSFFLALLLLPPWLAVLREAPEAAGRRLAWGLVLGLGGAMLAALWERLAFTGLLDFSSDYRTTALFWEMQAGGAAFDGFLALSVPFAVHLLRHARGSWQWGAAAALATLAGYTCLTTFSRAVYVAVPVSLMLMMALRARQAPRGAAGAGAPASADPVPVRLPKAAWLLVAAFAVAAAQLFHGGGYRGMLALLGTMLLLPPLAAALHRRRIADWLVGGAAGAAATAAGAVVAGALPKGAYLVYAGCWAVAAALVAWAAHGGPRFAGRARAALAASVACVCCVALVVRHWGGPQAVLDAMPGIALWLVALPVLARGRFAGALAGVRRQAALAAALGVAATLVGVLAGGTYAGTRFGSSVDDMAARVAHWRSALDALRTPADWTLGRGLGSFATDYALSAAGSEQTGDWRVVEADGGRHLALSSARQPGAFFQFLRVTQRVAPPQGAVSVRFDARAPMPSVVHLEICEKHLLYPGNCTIAAVGVPAGTAWAPVRATLPGERVIGRGDRYAPRLIAFSIAVGAEGTRVDVDNLRLVDAAGRDLLANGDFSAGAAHWFFTSDRVHMPWHMKGLFPHQLYEQGLAGALLLAALVASASWRLVAGSARGHALAPALAAALAGFVLIGVSDSLLDAPRVAFLFYLLLLVALTLPGARFPAVLPAARAGGRSGRGGVAVAAGLVVLFAGWLGVAPDAAAQPDAGPADARRISVGPTREVKTLADAARRAVGRALIEVDAGDYRGDAATAVWDRGDVTLRAVGGRVRLHADGAAAEGKAIWVVRNARVEVAGFDFLGARVADTNGAGIRLESGALAVRDCVFLRNENGILVGNDPRTVLTVENSEFGYNGHGDGQSHNLYAGAIASLSVTGSWFHHAQGGHLLKSRAAVSRIFYNRLADGPGGRASYELEFPNGGVALVVGNLIQQSAETENPDMLSYGAEGPRWPRNALMLVNNTFVDRRPAGGRMLRVWPGDVALRGVNNLLVGNGAFEAPGDANLRVATEDFAAVADNDADAWRLAAGSRLAVTQAVDAGSFDGEPLRPAREYRHPRSSIALDAAAPLRPGALQRPAARRSAAVPALSAPTP